MAKNEYRSEVEELKNQLEDLQARMQKSGEKTWETIEDYSEEASGFVREKAEQLGKGIRKAREQVQEYGEGHPWQIAGAAAAVGLLVGFLVARRRD